MFELTLIDDSRLDCMYKLTSWSDMKSTILANLDDNFSNVWQNDVKVIMLKLDVSFCILHYDVHLIKLPC